MSTKEQLQTQAEDLKKKLAELEKTIKEMPDKKEGYTTFQPKEGQTYWSVGCITGVSWGSYANLSKTLWQPVEGNRMFSSKKEAEEYHEYLTVHELLRRSPGARPFKKGKDNYHFVCFTDRKKLHLDCLTVSLRAGQVYFEDKNSITQARHVIGDDRIIKYLTYEAKL